MTTQVPQGDSTSDKPYRPNIITRVFDKATEL